MDVPHWVYPFEQRWTSGLSPPFGYHEVEHLTLNRLPVFNSPLGSGSHSSCWEGCDKDPQQPPQLHPTPAPGSAPCSLPRSSQEASSKLTLPTCPHAHNSRRNPTFPVSKCAGGRPQLGSIHLLQCPTRALSRLTSSPEDGRVQDSELC